MWNLPSPSSSMEGTGNFGISMPLSTTEFAYNIVQQTSANPNLTSPQQLDLVLEPIWAQVSLATKYPLDLVFPSSEEILEALIGPNRPWDDLHHRSYFLSELRRIEVRELASTVNGDKSCPINPLAMHGVYGEDNMESITTTIPIDISETLCIVENVFIEADFYPKEVITYTELFMEFCEFFAWSYDEMSIIDPQIVDHEITTYTDAKTIR